MCLVSWCVDHDLPSLHRPLTQSQIRRPSPIPVTGRGISDWVGTSMHFESMESRRHLSASPQPTPNIRPVESVHLTAVQVGTTVTLSNVNSVQIIDDGRGGLTVY